MCPRRMSRRSTDGAPTTATDGGAGGGRCRAAPGQAEAPPLWPAARPWAGARSSRRRIRAARPSSACFLLPFCVVGVVVVAASSPRSCLSARLSICESILGHEQKGRERDRRRRQGSLFPGFPSFFSTRLPLGQRVSFAVTRAHENARASTTPHAETDPLGFPCAPLVFSALYRSAHCTRPPFARRAGAPSPPFGLPSPPIMCPFG